MGSVPIALALSTALFAFLLPRLYPTYVTRRVRNALPPGPHGLPVLGNAFQIPRKHSATYYKHVLDTYGKIASVKVFNHHLVLVGDRDVAKLILEKHSANFSSRFTTLYWRRYIDPLQLYWAFSEQGKNNFIGRKLTVGLMADIRNGRCDLMQEFEALWTVRCLFEDLGATWYHQIYRVTASTVFAALFGVRLPTGNEPELQEIIQVSDELVESASPTASIINFIPALDYLPGPMPWRTRAGRLHQRLSHLYGKLVDEALTGRSAGLNTWASAFAKEDGPDGDQRKLINQFTGAAIETTATTLRTFVLACILHPQWILHAQKEIDVVVGLDRLPSLKDRVELPIVDAIMREVFRWRPALRLGVPHMSTADDVIDIDNKAYFIPKGSIVCAVTWAIEHDKERYLNPDAFLPERFLNDKRELLPNYESSAFGFGRRGCPGVPFAERTVWINIAMILWTFNIRKSTQAGKSEVFHYSDADDAFNPEIMNGPLEFPAVFEHRDIRRMEIVRSEWANCEKDLSRLL